MVRPIKREFFETSSSDGGGEATPSGSDHKARTDRRVLRSRYLDVKTRIYEDREGMRSRGSDEFNSIFNQIESLHQLVQKPREQKADAEALLDITSTLMSSVKAQNKEGITVSDFVSSLLRNFGGSSVGPSCSKAKAERNTIAWRDVGLAVSNAFRTSSGLCTINGTMDKELKQRKVSSRRSTRPILRSHPKELDHTGSEKAIDTEKNMATMFDILRKNRRVRLENLVLNRNSFAQTVENLFALSFLVRDGRAEMEVHDNGCHFVSPRNAPSASEVASRKAAYNHFVFRFDFKDWKLMTSLVKDGEELMPQRNIRGISSQHGTNPELQEEGSSKDDDYKSRI